MDNNDNYYKSNNNSDIDWPQAAPSPGVFELSSVS